MANAMKVLDHVSDIFDRGKWAGKLTDFLTDEDLTEYVITAIGSGTNAVLDTGLHGVMQLSGAATTDNSGAEAQRDAAWVGLAVNKRNVYTARFRVTETTSANVATESDLYFGLGKLDTSFEASKPSDYIVLKKVDGGTSFAFDITMGSSAIAALTGLGTIVAGQWYQLTIVVQMSSTSQKGTVYAWLYDETAGTEAQICDVYSESLTMGTSQMLSETATFQTGDNTGTKWAEVDYIGSWNER